MTFFSQPSNGAMKVLRAQPTRQYARPGPWTQAFPDGGLILGSQIDEVVAQQGWRAYELMRYDAAVDGAIGLLKSGIVSDGLRLSPAVQARPGEVVSQRKQKAEIALAGEITDSVQRSLDRLERPLDEFLDQFLEGMAWGAAVAEQTYEVAEDGPDRGRLVLKSLDVLPRWAWAFRVDEFRKVRAIRAWTAGFGWQDVERSKFCVLSWRPRPADPRGTSLLRSAYTPWNLKMQQWPEYGEYLHHFADPSLIITAGPDTLPIRTVNAQGKTVVTSPLEQISNALTGYRNRSGVALPAGAAVTIVNSQGEGQAHVTAFDRFDLEIFRAILFSPRPMQEARYGSRADSQTGLDLVGMAFTNGRKPLARAIQDDILFRFTELNWGKETAERFTPNVNFGLPDHAGPDLLNAYAKAYQVGLIEDSQLPAIWDKLGLPQGDLEELKARNASKTPTGRRLDGPPGTQPRPKSPNTSKPGAPAPAPAKTEGP